MPAAFVTGGSGFVGGALIERLRREGWEVRALVRSEAAAERVRSLGAEPAMGDLDDVASLESGARGCEVAFHAAAKVEDWGDPADYERINVQGTQNVIDACRAAGVRRLVHVGTEAALMAGQPLVNVDETAPLRPDSPALYPWSKAKAERRVRDANGDGLETVVVRPRFVWGRGDTSLLPAIVEMVKAGRFLWIGGGRQLTATTHIDNTVEGLWLAATRGAPGGVYFVTDGEPAVFRDFLTELLASQGVAVPDRSMPAGAARVAAAASEWIWRVLKRPGSPPVTRFAVWVSSLECTIDISRAERELGYVPVRSREEGLRELTSSPPG
ncbi:MAG TPA: NAD-dependent epimerase/dehydratase family protein [Thermoleophilaceae bacterium]|jgi:nucleoside-diphosphate-sugar epimerase|nr:NAD-dependent epimerase/dehydratase family protein [Thermoleophilaceae bacterium]